MLGYIFLVLTFIFYIILLQFQPRVGPGDITGSAILLVLYVMTITCSLVLTISVVRHGGFDWISKQSNIRNIVVGIGWLCITGANLGNWKSGSDNFPEFLQWLAKSNAQIGILLLLLVSCFFLLNTELRASVSSNVYKIPLMMGVGISVVMFLGALLLRPEQKRDPLDKSQLSYERSVEIINSNYKSGAYYEIWEFTSRNIDERVRKLALERIKANEDWEMLLKESSNDYGKFLGVYAYLDGNTLEHPEQFIEPINNSISDFTRQIKEAISSTDTSEEYLQYLDAERLCRVLEEHFKDSSAVFRPNMLKLQKTLEMVSLNRFANTHNKYRIAVKNWLAANP